MAFRNQIAQAVQVDAANGRPALNIAAGPNSIGQGEAVVQWFTGGADEQNPAEAVAIADGPNAGDNYSLFMMSPSKASQNGGGRGYLQLFARTSSTGSEAVIGGDFAKVNGVNKAIVQGPAGTIGASGTDVFKWDTGAGTGAAGPLSWSSSSASVNGPGVDVSGWLQCEGAATLGSSATNPGAHVNGSLTAGDMPNKSNGGAPIGGWQNYPGGWNPVTTTLLGNGHTVLSSGIVERTAATFTASSDAYYQIATVPAALAPNVNTMLPGVSNGVSNCGIAIHSDGTVWFVSIGAAATITASSTWFAWNGAWSI